MAHQKCLADHASWHVRQEHPDHADSSDCSACFRARGWTRKKTAPTSTTFATRQPEEEKPTSLHVAFHEQRIRKKTVLARTAPASKQQEQASRTSCRCPRPAGNPCCRLCHKNGKDSAVRFVLHQNTSQASCVLPSVPNRTCQTFQTWSQTYIQIRSNHNSGGVMTTAKIDDNILHLFQHRPQIILGTSP